MKIFNFKVRKLSILYVYGSMRGQKLAGHVFHEHLHKNEKFQLTVFSYSYGPS